MKILFFSVVSELKRFKDEQGYKYLTIWTYNNGYATQINKNLLEKAGFKNIPDQKSCMYVLRIIFYDGIYKEKKATNATNIRRFNYKSNNLKCNMYIVFLLYQIFLILSINSYLLIA